jgi:superfamily II DNA or RNA helicase
MISVQETATHLIVRGPSSELTVLVDDFAFRPPGYYYARSYQRHRVSDGKEGWDGYVRPFKKVDKEVAQVPRGRKKDLIRFARENGYRLDLSKLLPLPFADLQIDDVRDDLIAGDFRLDMNQRLCILDWLRAGIGLHKVTVGGGKTATFAGVAAFIKEKYPNARFIYLTPSERLVRQSCKEMKKMLPHFEIGQLGGGQHDYDAQDMVIGTVAMLNRHFMDLSSTGWFETFMAILYDEVHHAAAASSQKILNAIPAYFRFGASDTAKENDITKYTAIRGSFGPLLREVGSAPLIKKGRLAEPHIYVVDLPDWKGRFKHIEYRPVPESPAFVLREGVWVQGKYLGPVFEIDRNGKVKVKMVKSSELEDDEKDYHPVTNSFKQVEVPVRVEGMHRLLLDGVEQEVESKWCLLERVYDRAVIQFKSRNEMICQWINYFHKQGWPTVVVATRTTHVYILESLIKKVIDPDLVEILTGYENDSPEKRDRMFKWFKSTPGAVLITPLIKEGVSINEIQAMVVADPIADYEVARQIIGRAMRPKVDNRAHVVWFWDRQHPSLQTACGKVLDYLEHVEGFQFYHPCAGPETVFGSSGA